MRFRLLVVFLALILASGAHATVLSTSYAEGRYAGASSPNPDGQLQPLTGYLPGIADAPNLINDFGGGTTLDWHYWGDGTGGSATAYGPANAMSGGSGIGAVIALTGDVLAFDNNDYSRVQWDWTDGTTMVSGSHGHGDAGAGARIQKGDGAAADWIDVTFAGAPPGRIRAATLLIARQADVDVLAIQGAQQVTVHDHAAGAASGLITVEYSGSEILTIRVDATDGSATDESGYVVRGVAATLSEIVDPAQGTRSTDPSPFDTERITTTMPVLSWTPSAMGVTHDVYFGTDFNAVLLADHGSPAFKGNRAGVTYDPGALYPATLYYWRVDDLDGGTTTHGDVWSFATPIEPPTAFRIGWDTGRAGVPSERASHFANLAASGLNTVCFNTRLISPGVTTWELQPDGSAVIVDWPGTGTYTKMPLQSPQDFRDYCNEAALHGLAVLFTHTLYSVDWDQLAILGGYQETYIGGPTRYSNPGWNKMPAPLEEKYWLGLFKGVAEFYANLSLVCPNVIGFVVDFETYPGTNGSTYMPRDHSSFDDQTWSAVTAHLGVSPPAVSIDQRYYWMEGQGLLDDYFASQAALIRSRIADPIRQAIDAINPDFMLGFYPYWPSARLHAYVHGWSTPGAAVLVMNEDSYYGYRAPHMLSHVAALNATGANFVPLPGLMVHAQSHTPQGLEDDVHRIEHFQGHDAGYWVFRTETFLTDPPGELTDPPEAFWQAISNANFGVTALSADQLFFPEEQAPTGSTLVTANRFFAGSQGGQPLNVTWSRSPDLTSFESPAGDEMFDGGEKYNAWVAAWAPVLSEEIATEVDLGRVVALNKLTVRAATHLPRHTTCGGVLTIETSADGQFYAQLDQQTLSHSTKRSTPFMYQGLQVASRFVRVRFDVTDVPANSAYTMVELAAWATPTGGAPGIAYTNIGLDRTMVLELATDPGILYQLQHRPDPAGTGAWENTESTLTGNGGSMYFFDPATPAETATARIYRIMVP